MNTVGNVSPKSVEEVQTRYDELTAVARTTVREIARAMGFDAEEFDERVTDDVIRTAQDVIFAGSLEVTIGSKDEYRSWKDAYDGQVIEAGHEQVDNAVWHAGPDGEAVAATFQHETDAAVATLRRQAFGRLYRHIVYE